MQGIEIEKRLSEYNDIMKENDNIYRDIAKKFGLSECAFWILYFLRTDKNALTQSDIRSSMYQSKQTVNSALKNLETNGYIELIHVNDQRSKQINLTEKGMELAERTADKIIIAEQDAILELTEAEQEKFISLFRKYTEALKQKMNVTGVRK